MAKVKLLMMCNFSFGHNVFSFTPSFIEIFQVFVTLSFMEIFQVFVTMFSKWSAADLLLVGKLSLVELELNL